MHPTWAPHSFLSDDVGRSGNEILNPVTSAKLQTLKTVGMTQLNINVHKYKLIELIFGAQQKGCEGPRTWN